MDQKAKAKRKKKTILQPLGTDRSAYHYNTIQYNINKTERKGQKPDDLADVMSATDILMGNGG